MKQLKASVVALSLVTTCLLPSSASAETFNDVIVAIFGAGNPDTGWTSETAEGITLAMRGKNRSTGDTTNVNGVYNFDAGLVAPATNRAKWNWEFSINSGTVTLDQYDYYAGVDTDSSVGVSQMVVDALTTFADNSYGTSATLNGQGFEGPAATLAGSNTIAQQSQNIVFWGQDANLNATYDYELFAVEKGAGPTGEKIVSTTITVIVGSGGASVEALLAELAASATTHGEYVAAVSDLTKYLMAGDVIDKKRRKEIMTAAAQSTIGK